MRDTNVGMRVIDVNVVTRGHEDDVRSKTTDQPGQDVLIDREVLLVSGTGKDRKVIGVPFALAPAPVHVLAGIGIVGVLVRTEIKDRIVLFKDVLGAVAVVSVEIDDEHPVVANGLGISGAYGNIIENTEPHGQRSLGMVSRRSDSTEDSLQSVGAALVNSFHDRTCCVERCHERSGGNIRIRIDLSFSMRPHPLDMLKRVDARKVPDVCGARFDAGDVLRETGGRQSGSDGKKPVLRVRMPDWRGVVKKNIVVDEANGIHDDPQKGRIKDLPPEIKSTILAIMMTAPASHQRYLRILYGIMAIALLAGAMQSVSAGTLSDFTSDGCSLFPDGELGNRKLWCDCCFDHDVSYWRGGTDTERKNADKVLRACVLKRTNSRSLADLMYQGVRAGGHPAFPTWYRWGYGWDYGRGYKPLSNEEELKVQDRMKHYFTLHPNGYCGKP